MQEWYASFLVILESPWALLGFAGQALFFSRWVVQWIASEKRKESHVPLAFWYISLAGGVLIMIYAVHRHDPVFMMGQTIGIANYGRNIMLIHRKAASR
ncbi:MAG: lipid-A-disaccharide synthase N-terminal domain-containing protein [Acidobacteriota bacterium]|nr:lipid-A-disaccharide synthase N-terminal domain-containing protein [Acidobacteriota bacterium]